LRWDKANISWYYDVSYRHLNNITVPNSLTGNYDPCNAEFDIEHFYSEITSALKRAASETIPKRKQNFFKFWWDSELDAAKQKSISVHYDWVCNGKPRTGLLHTEMTKRRLAYKALIKLKEKESKNYFTNELSDALLNKNQINFWKCWKSKFKNKNKSQTINGVCDQGEISNIFAKYFGSLHSTDPSSCNINFKDIFEKRYTDYVGKDFISILTVSDVDRAIRQMKTGKASGMDGLMTEHIINSHPILIILLTILFNALLKYKRVPLDFTRGIVIPLLKGNDTDSSCVDNYRGITLSCIISKVFEICLLQLFKPFLLSSDLQFGFKANNGCMDAILTARTIVSYYTDRQSTVTMCALDLSKAFDKLNHHALFIKLMKRNTPRVFIELIYYWYANCTAVVRWGEFLSAPFLISAGVRQGGVLSPSLFAIYIDDLIQALIKTGYGCHINSIFLGCLLYADDILLIASSVVEMQKMLDICADEMNAIGMCFNADKSVVMRIGKRFKMKCSELLLSGKVINYVDKMKYLGIVFNAGKRISCSIDHLKLSFYRAFNALYYRSKSANSELVSTELLKSCCIPIISYAMEVAVLSDSLYKKCDNLIDNCVRKIFNVTDDSVVKHSRLMLGLRSIKLDAQARTCKFLIKLYKKSCVFSRVIFDLAFTEFVEIGATYPVQLFDSKIGYLHAVLANITASF
jgi:hypothetical protein